MNSLITYILELNLVITGLFLVYRAVFSRDANFSARRIILVLAMLCAFIMPLLNVSIHHPASDVKLQVFSLEELVFKTNQDGQTVGGPTGGGQSWMISILLYAYLLVSSIIFLRLLVMIGSIYIEKSRSELIWVRGILARKSKKLHASSFFSALFIDPDQLEAGMEKELLEHELCHIRHWHSIDRILAEILLAFGWINPVTWMFRKSVVENHEYQADNLVIKQGTDQVSYSLNLLNQYIGSASFSISNQFSHQLKKRIIMLEKNYKKGTFWKSMIFVPVAALLMFLVSCSNDTATEELIDNPESTAENELFYVVEEMPRWHDGTELFPHVRQFIAKNLNYPDEAINKGVQGKVFVHFIVTSEGKIEVPDPQDLPHEMENGNKKEVVVVAYRKINEDDADPDDKYVQMLKDEAVRVVGEIPDVLPGKQRGKAVNVVFTMPITFKLQ